MDAKNQTILNLINIASILNRSIPIPLLIFGTIGNILNIYILTRKSLRTNSCTFYFLTSTIANLICLWSGLLTRLLSGYNLDPTVWNTTICKIRFFITYMSLSLSACFLVYASIDRWASSSLDAHIRLFSRMSIARRMVFYTIIIACLAYGQTFYCYSSVENQFPVNCYCPNIICRTYNDILFLIFFSILPPILMLIFGLITIQNVKKIRRQVHPNMIQSDRYQHLMKRKDRQMLTMLLIQVIFFFICATPSGISKAYSTLTLYQNKDSLELTKENFFFQVTVLILYVNCCCAFYIYTLSGTIFRREVKCLILKLRRVSITDIVSVNPSQVAIVNRSIPNDLHMKCY